MLKNYELPLFNCIFLILHIFCYIIISLFENEITMYDDEINFIVNYTLFFLVFCFSILQVLLNLCVKYFGISETVKFFVFVGFCFLLLFFYVLDFSFFLIFYNYYLQ